LKLSTRTRYGLRAAVVLAENFGKGPLQLKTIAEKQDISVKYLEQLMAVLKSAGLVRSVRGSKGGYVLAKPPKQIKVSECFNCFEGSVITAECVGDINYCSRAADCAAREVWSRVQRAVMSVLESFTLQDLVDITQTAKTLSYQI